MEQETDALLQNFKAVEASYGAEVLTLGVSCRYVGRMLNSSKVREHIELRHPEVLAELESLVASVESESNEAPSN